MYMIEKIQYQVKRKKICLWQITVKVDILYGCLNAVIWSISYTFNMFYFRKNIFIWNLFIWAYYNKPSTNGRKKMLNKCETQNKIVFHISLRHSRNDKQCFAKHCFANQTNRYRARFASRSEMFRYSAQGKQNIVDTLISNNTSCWKPCTQPCDLRHM